MDWSSADSLRCHPTRGVCLASPTQRLAVRLQPFLRSCPFHVAGHRASWVGSRADQEEKWWLALSNRMVLDLGRGTHVSPEESLVICVLEMF